MNAHRHRPLDWMEAMCKQWAMRIVNIMNCYRITVTSSIIRALAWCLEMGREEKVYD